MDKIVATKVRRPLWILLGIAVGAAVGWHFDTIKSWFT